MMLAPTLALLGAFFVVPLLLAVYYSTLRWDLLTEPRFVGLSNYRAIVRSGRGVAHAQGNTLRYSLAVVSGSTALGLSLAVLLNRPGRWFAFVRSAVFSAYVMSWVSVALLWMWVLDPDDGAIAAVMRLHASAARWVFYTTRTPLLVTLAAVSVWKLTGYALVVFSGALQSVPVAQLEAAALDGAGPLARFRSVTWAPQRPTTAFVMTTGLDVSFQAFDVVRIMTQGAPAGATTLFVYAIYEQIFLDLAGGARERVGGCVLCDPRGPVGAPAAGMAHAVVRGAMRATRAVRAAVTTLSILAAAAWVAPYAWMVSTSLKTLPEIMRTPSSPLPARMQFGAYREVFASIPVVHYVLVSTAVAFAIAAIQIALALPAGYVLAKLRFRGKSAAFGIAVSCLLVPAQVTFVPVFVMLARLHLVNTFAALVLPFGASALGTFLVRQALLRVPDEIIEAARMDGASELTIVYRILGPILAPTLASFFMISFVFHWNDYFWPLVMTMDETVRTLPLGVALLREQGTGVRWNIVMAGNVVLSLPPLMLFALAQRQLLRGVARG